MGQVKVAVCNRSLEEHPDECPFREVEIEDGTLLNTTSCGYHPAGHLGLPILSVSLLNSCSPDELERISVSFVDWFVCSLFIGQNEQDRYSLLPPKPFKGCNTFIYA